MVDNPADLVRFSIEFWPRQIGDRQAFLLRVLIHSCQQRQKIQNPFTAFRIADFSHFTLCKTGIKIDKFQPDNRAFQQIVKILKFRKRRLQCRNCLQIKLHKHIA